MNLRKIFQTLVLASALTLMSLACSALIPNSGGNSPPPEGPIPPLTVVWKDPSIGTSSREWILKALREDYPWLIVRSTEDQFDPILQEDAFVVEVGGTHPEWGGVSVPAVGVGFVFSESLRGWCVVGNFETGVSNVLAHEVGHLLGWDHVNEIKNVMHAGVSPYACWIDQSTAGNPVPRDARERMYDNYTGGFGADPRESPGVQSLPTLGGSQECLYPSNTITPGGCLLQGIGDCGREALPRGR